MTDRRRFLAGAGGAARAALASSRGVLAAPVQSLPANLSFAQMQSALAALYQVDRTIVNFDAAYYGAMTKEVHAAYLDKLGWVNRYNSTFLRSGVADIVMGKAGFDWVADGQKLQAEGAARSIAAAAEIDAKQAAGAAPGLPLSAYAGTWRDPWYGDITIEQRTEGRGRNRKTGLWLAFSRTPALKGWLEPYDGETFRTRFVDRREEDAFVTFAIAGGMPVTATLKGVSPDIDFSYDYQDLRLTRVLAGVAG